MVDTTNTQPAGAIGRESSLSNWAGDYVTDMLGKGWAASEMPYFAYQGPLTAGSSNLQNQAWQGIGSLGLPDATANFNPTDFNTNRFDNNWAQQYMNPYMQQALNPQLDEMRRQAQITRLGDAGRMTQAGAFGGSRQAILESELNNSLMRNQAEVTGAGYRDAFDKAMGQFNTDEDRILKASGMGEASRQFGAGLGLQGLGSLLDVYRAQAQMGDTQRGVEQQGIDADYAQFREERDYPYKQVQFMQSLLQGLPLEAQNYEMQDLGLIEKILAGAEGGTRIFDLLEKLFGGSNTTTPPPGSGGTGTIAPGGTGPIINT
jgi:hypothetical protein